MGKSNYNKEHCTNKVRKNYTSTNGFEVVVKGIHSYEWTATISCCCFAFSITYPSRIECERDLSKRYPKGRNSDDRMHHKQRK